MSGSSMRLSLSLKGLRRLEQVNHEKDFAFIVGDERYSCPSFVAEFLSPRISSLRAQDVTMSEFSIETEDPGHHFETLLSIGFGNEISVSPQEVGFVRIICGELWNYELFEATIKQGNGQIDKEGLKARLNFLSGVDQPCDWGISVVAPHFHEFSASDFDRLSPSVLEALLSDPSLVVRDENSVFEIVHRLASKDPSYFGLLEFVRFEFLSDDCMKTAVEFISTSFESFTFGIWSSLRNRLSLAVTPPSPPNRFKPLPAIDSEIISAIPEIFSVFGEKRFQLLYRGSRDGFQASDFHRQCNGHPNTVTLILSTNGSIFGGYTPLSWSSRDGYASDASQKSFLFTIKNPHNLTAQIFKQQEEACAIYDYSGYGPTFGRTTDLHVCNQSQTCNNSYSYLLHTYGNDTGIAGNQVLTGAQYFTSKEIEVFEVV
jgi:hypothetical protein